MAGYGYGQGPYGQPGYGVPPQQSYGAPAPAPYGAPAGPYGATGPYQVPAPGGYGYGGAPAPAPYGAPPGAPYMVPPHAAPQPAYGAPPGGIPVIPGAPPPAAYSAPPVPVKVEPAKPVIYVPDDQSVGTPTCFPAKDFDAERDATAIDQAFKLTGGLRTVINVLAYRSTAQRQEVRKFYKTMTGRDLLTTIDENSSRNTQRLLQAMCRERDERDAHTINKAFKGFGYEPDIIIYILVSRSAEELKNVKARYQEMYGLSLEDHIIKETQGPFQKLLIGLAQANRTDWKEPVDVSKCKRDAEALYKAGEGKWGVETSEFRRILNLRSVPQLRCVIDQYSKISKRTLEESCKREMKGDLLKAVKKIIRFAQDPYLFYANELYKSMKGFGTDDRKLIHIVVDRCEVDMADVKKRFEAQYKATLASWIRSECSYEYKDCLLALIGDL